MGCCSLKNCAIFWAAIFLGVSYFLYTPIPNGFAEPWKLRSVLAAVKTLGVIASVSEMVGYDSSLNVTRSFCQTMFRPTSQDDPELKVTDTTFDGVPVRIYEPIKIQKPAPALMYYHGGGWVLLSVDGYDGTASEIAKQANIIVISVDYRLAPEHPFPIPFDDCVTATIHLLQNSGKYGVDSSRVAIGGDSAGGNLAAAVAQRLSIESETFIPKIKLQVLLYPVTQAVDFNLPSYTQNGGFGGLLTKKAMIKFWMSYLGFKDVNKYYEDFANNQHTSTFLKHSQYTEYVSLDLLPEQIQNQAERIPSHDEDINVELADKLEDLLINPYLSPLMAEKLTGLPPAYIMNAEFDVLRDDGLLYGQRLKNAGVKVHVNNVKHAYHGCLGPPQKDGAFEMTPRIWKDINKYIKDFMYK